MGQIDNLLLIDREYLYIMMTLETAATEAFNELIVSLIIFGQVADHIVAKRLGSPIRGRYLGLRSGTEDQKKQWNH